MEYTLDHGCTYVFSGVCEGNDEPEPTGVCETNRGAEPSPHFCMGPGSAC